MRPVEIEFLVRDKTQEGAQRVSASVDRETLKVLSKMDRIQAKIDKLLGIGSQGSSAAAAGRMTAFFCLCGVFFSAAALAGSGLNGIGRNGASVLWLFANLLPLLRPVKKARDED